MSKDRNYQMSREDPTEVGEAIEVEESPSSVKLAKIWFIQYKLNCDVNIWKIKRYFKIFKIYQIKFTKFQFSQ